MIAALSAGSNASAVRASELSRVELVAVGATSGPSTAAAQTRLTELGFWTGPANGEYGFTTAQAVMAFQKYVSLPISGRLDQATTDQLNGLTERARGTKDTGSWVEVDKARQLVFIVVKGETLWTFNTSTGSRVANSEFGDAVTPDGLWTVKRERPMGWWRGELGELYRPKYFSGAVAVHGSNSVPKRAASHGCVRVSVEAMDFIWEHDLISIGTKIWVHE
ncbi:MAG: L,D-transpeptidase family protein [Ilumatobacteraceae bacterium]